MNSSLLLCISTSSARCSLVKIIFLGLKQGFPSFFIINRKKKLFLKHKISMISTSEPRLEHLFAGRNTQHLKIQVRWMYCSSLISGSMSVPMAKLIPILCGILPSNNSKHLQMEDFWINRATSSESIKTFSSNIYQSFSTTVASYQ